jgi:hypothetical protein
MLPVFVFEGGCSSLEVSYVYEAKPVLMNKFRTLHWRVWGPLNKEWREAFYWLGKENYVCFDVPVDIVVKHEIVKGIVPDTASSLPCFKASLDGLVDSGVIEDDSPRYVRNVTFLAPEKTGRDALTIVLTSVDL